MPRAPRRSAPKRRSAPPAAATFDPQEPLMLNGEEKRELILAHAAAREHEPREWGIGYAVGLLATILIVVTGWVLTFDRNLRMSLPTKPDTIVSGTQERVDTVFQNAPTPKQVGDSVEAQRRAYQAALENLRNQQATTTKSIQP